MSNYYYYDTKYYFYKFSDNHEKNMSGQNKILPHPPNHFCKQD